MTTRREFLQQAGTLAAVPVFVPLAIASTKETVVASKEAVATPILYSVSADVVMRITGRKGESYESLCKKVTDAETAQDYLKLSDKVLPFITGIKQGIEYGFGDNGDGGGLTADPAIDLPMVVYATDLEILKTQFLTRDWSKSLPNHYIFDCLVVVELSRPRIREELAVEYGSLYRSLPASGEKTTL